MRFCETNNSREIRILRKEKILNSFDYSRQFHTKYPINGNVWSFTIYAETGIVMNCTASKEVFLNEISRLIKEELK